MFQVTANPNLIFFLCNGLSPTFSPMTAQAGILYQSVGTPGFAIERFYAPAHIVPYTWYSWTEIFMNFPSTFCLRSLKTGSSGNKYSPKERMVEPSSNTLKIQGFIVRRRFFLFSQKSRNSYRVTAGGQLLEKSGGRTIIPVNSTCRFCCGEGSFLVS